MDVLRNQLHSIGVKSPGFVSGDAFGSVMPDAKRKQNRTNTGLFVLVLVPAHFTECVKFDCSPTL